LFTLTGPLLLLAAFGAAVNLSWPAVLQLLLTAYCLPFSAALTGPNEFIFLLYI